MDRHRALQHGVGHARIHHVEDAVDRLVAAGAEDGRAEDLARLGIDDDLHEPLRLAFLDRAADAGHRTLADRGAAGRVARACASVMPTRPSGGSMYSA